MVEEDTGASFSLTGVQCVLTHMNTWVCARIYKHSIAHTKAQLLWAPVL